MDSAQSHPNVFSAARNTFRPSTFGLLSDFGLRISEFTKFALSIDITADILLTFGVTLSEYILLAGSSLFVIVDPLATAPAFLAMTPNDTPEQRLRTAKVASCAMAAVLLIFSAAGTVIFKIFGITMPAFQIAASIVLLIIALDMLRVQRSRVQETREEKQAGTEKNDIAITPLAIPMLAGPGAISTTILLQNEASTIPQHIALYGCILIVSVATYLTFRLAVRSARWLNPIAMSIAIRIMGLLLAAIAVQFMLTAIKQYHAEWIASP